MGVVLEDGRRPFPRPPAGGHRRGAPSTAVRSVTVMAPASVPVMFPAFWVRLITWSQLCCSMGAERGRQKQATGVVSGDGAPWFPGLWSRPAWWPRAGPLLSVQGAGRLPRLGTMASLHLPPHPMPSNAPPPHVLGCVSLPVTPPGLSCRTKTAFFFSGGRCPQEVAWPPLQVLGGARCVECVWREWEGRAPSVCPTRGPVWEAHKSSSWGWDAGDQASFM